MAAVPRSSISHDGTGLRDLPAETLAHAATFLAGPSRALLAVALGGGGSRSRSHGGSHDATIDAVIGLGLGLHGANDAADAGRFEVLDFGQLEPSVASKLTDDDLRAVLVCVDAPARLRRLKLAGCVNLTGAGLDPLRGSTVLEQIDLSLVAEHESLDLDPAPRLSRESVLPILDSLVGAADNSIRHLHFPKHWGADDDNSAAYNEFLERCNEMYLERRVRCEECQCLLGRSRGRATWLVPSGVQNYTCSSCLKNLCCDCQDINRHLIYSLWTCQCEREFCRECLPVEEVCDGCHGPPCSIMAVKNCVGTRRGGECDVTLQLCDRCIRGYVATCDLCGALLCDSCFDLATCSNENCFKLYCGSCFGSEDASRCDECA